MNKLIKNFKNHIPAEFKIFEVISIIIITIFLGWGISNATDSNDIKTATTNFSVLGTVSEMSGVELTVNDAKGSDNPNVASYKLNLEYLKIVETNNYSPLSIGDIKVGDKIIAQGLTNGSTFFIKRVVSFSSTAHTDTATSTSTESTSTAPLSTSTPNDGSGNPPESGTTTPVIIPPADNGTSTEGTTTQEVGTSTPPEATTTPESGTTTPPTPPEATSTPSVMDNLINVVRDVIQTVTGGSGSDGNNQNPEAPPQSP